MIVREELVVERVRKSENARRQGTDGSAGRSRVQLYAGASVVADSPKTTEDEPRHSLRLDL